MGKKQFNRLAGNPERTKLSENWALKVEWPVEIAQKSDSHRKTSVPGLIQRKREVVEVVVGGGTGTGAAKGTKGSGSGWDNSKVWG